MLAVGWWLLVVGGCWWLVVVVCVGGCVVWFLGVVVGHGAWRGVSGGSYGRW